jgi:ectoine hydroxylase-related dioxygenase (phytanoyl-CoA dioxygenase family)
VSYPAATGDDIQFFQEHGWIIVRGAIDPKDLDVLEARCDEIMRRKDKLAFDWAWQKDERREERDFKILQSSPTHIFPEINESRFRTWAIEFASALMGQPVEFWYDQFLAKAPGKNAPTPWHQDEGYWGRNLDDRGLTCWMPFHDVDPSNGCMHFIDRGHKHGVLEHHRPPEMASDLLVCEPDEADVVACPLRLGDVTFHHSKTPHMTTANTSGEWRRILTQHLRVVGSGDEGGHYPWKVYVNQFTGEEIHPERG